MDVPDIVEVDEEGDIEEAEGKAEQAAEESSPRQTGSPIKDGNPLESAEGLDEASRNSPTRTRRERSADKNKVRTTIFSLSLLILSPSIQSNRRLAGSKLDTSMNKVPSDAVSVKSRGAESEQNTPMDVHAPAPTLEQQDSVSKSNPEVTSNPNVTKPIKKLYTTPKIWMDFDDFCSCFTSVVVFHNPRGYQYVHKHTEIKVRGVTRPVVSPSSRTSLDFNRSELILHVCIF